MEVEQKVERKKRPVVVRRNPDVKDLEDYLTSLELHVKPTIHINGHMHPTAILTVDFGTPLKPIKISNDQIVEMTGKMKKLTREVLGKDVNISVMPDQANGVFYAKLA